MTPLELARAECANYERDGGCLGVMLGADGRITSCTPRASCLLAESKRSVYFEECVAGMQHVVTDPRRAVAIQAAVREYRKQTNQVEEIPRECPDCGRPVPGRKRYCPVCSVKRRKATFRRAWHKGRDVKDGNSTVKPKTPSNSLGNAHVFPGVSCNPYGDGGYPQNHNYRRS